MKYSPKYKLLLAIFICLWHTAILWASAESYSDQLRNKLMVPFNQIKTSTRNCSVNVLMQLKPDGNVAGLVVKGDPPQSEIEKQIYSLIVNSQPFNPPPPDLLSKSYIHMYFNWSETYTKGSPYPCHNHALSGPYFYEKPPLSLYYKLGLKVEPYEDIIISKVMQKLKALDNEPLITKTGSTVPSPDGSGPITKPFGHLSTIAYLKLKTNGSLDKVALKNTFKNPLSEKLLREALTAAQPFGQLPKDVLSCPFYRVLVDWVVLSKDSGTLTPAFRCQHLKSLPPDLK